MGHARGVLRHALGWSGASRQGFLWSSSSAHDRSLGVRRSGPPVLVAIGFSVLSSNVMILVGEALKGLSRVRDSMLVNGVLYPLVPWPCSGRRSGFWSRRGGFSLFGGTALAAGLGLALWRRALAGRSGRHRSTVGRFGQAAGLSGYR